MIDQAKGGEVTVGDSLCIFDLKVDFLYTILNLLIELNSSSLYLMLDGLKVSKGIEVSIELKNGEL